MSVSLSNRIATSGSWRGLIGIALIVFAIAGLVWLAGANPLSAFMALFKGAFGDRYLLAETLVTAVPLAIVGLGVVPALRAGVFTIGSQGQLIAGAALSTALILGGPDEGPILSLVLGLVGGILGGMLYALIAAILRAYFAVNEILSTLLLNYIAGFGLLWLLKGPLSATAQVATPRSDPLPNAAWLPSLLEGTRLHWGAVIVVLLAVGLMLWLHTRSGMLYRIFATNEGLAARLGLSAPRAIVRSFLFAGAMAGIAGWLQVAGVAHTLYPSVDGGLGFSGILVAVLGGLHPVGVIFASLLFAALTTGAQGMQMGTSVPAAIAIVAQGLVLLVVATSILRKKRS